MKTLKDFTDLQRTKFKVCKKIINILNIYGFEYKIGGSFVKFITDNANDFHDIDIIVPDSELNNILFQVKLEINPKQVSDLDSKYHYFRIICDNRISVTIMSDVNKVVDLNQTFMNMQLVKS